MNTIIDFLRRNAVWVAIAVCSLALLSPAVYEIKTFMLILAIESFAIALSGIAAFAYTKTDFSNGNSGANPGLIFLGVHICTGLIVLGVYIVQFSS